jgi:hypothetical protein
VVLILRLDVELRIRPQCEGSVCSERELSVPDLRPVEHGVVLVRLALGALSRAGRVNPHLSGRVRSSRLASATTVGEESAPTAAVVSASTLVARRRIVRNCGSATFELCSPLMAAGALEFGNAFGGAASGLPAGAGAPAPCILPIAGALLPKSFVAGWQACMLARHATSAHKLMPNSRRDMRSILSCGSAGATLDD